MKDKKYDVFISYRREGGEEEAWKLKLFLEKFGYRVFMDREAMRSGEFNVQLYEHINDCKDFLLVCTKGSMERCANEDDWVRLEVSHALEKGRNIIPIRVKGFTSAEFNNLPPDLAVLPRLQAITPQNVSYEESIRKIASYLESRPVLKYKRIASYVFSGLCFLAFLSMVIFGRLSDWGKFPANKKQAAELSEIEKQTIIYLSAINTNLAMLDDARDVLDRCFKGYTGMDDAEERIESYLKQIRKPGSYVSNEVSFPKDYAYASHLDELKQLAEETAGFADFIDLLKAAVFSEELGNDAKDQILTDFEKFVDTYAVLATTHTYCLFLPVTNPEDSLKDMLDVAGNLKMLPDIGGSSWVGGENEISALNRSIDTAQKSISELLSHINMCSGNMLEKYGISIS